MTEPARNVEITKDKLMKLLNRFIDESGDSEEDIAFRYELVERLTDNRGGQVTGYSEAGDPIVSLAEGSPWLKVLNEPAKVSIELQDWEVMGGGEDIPEHRQQPFKLEISTADDGVYFDVYPAICDEWDAVVPRAVSSRFGFHGKIEISQGVPSISISRDENDAALFIKTGNAAGISVEPETNAKIGRELKKNPHYPGDMMGHRNCVFVDDGYEFNTRMIEEHALAMTYYLIKHPQTPDLTPDEVTSLHEGILEKCDAASKVGGHHFGCDDLTVTGSRFFGHYDFTVTGGPLDGFTLKATFHDNLPMLKTMDFRPPAPAGRPVPRGPK